MNSIINTTVRFIKVIGCLLLITLLMTLGGCQDTENKRELNSGFWSDTPATHWYDALVSGNGHMGVLVFGDPHSERMVYNHEFLYEYIGSEAIAPPKIAPYLKKTRRLMLDGKYSEAVTYSYDSALKEGYPGLLWTDPYHPAFAMTIDQPENGTVKNYRREVDFTTGEVTVRWTDDKGDWIRRLFVSRSDNIIVQQIKNLSGEKVDCTIGIEHQEGDVANRTNYLTGGDSALFIKTPEIKVDLNFMTFRLGYSKVERGYEGVVKVIADGGSTTVGSSTLDIKQANEVLLISRIDYLEDYGRSFVGGTKEALNALPEKYRLLLVPHAKIHKEMFSRAQVRFTGNTKTSQSTSLSIEKLFEKQEKEPDRILPELLNKVYGMGKYVLICSSGDNPPNLVGKWTGDWRPTWSGDFTLDANVNLQVAGVNTLGLDECLDSYLKMIERIAPDWEVNASNLYGLQGYVSGARTSGRRNLNTHFSKNFPGQFWTAGAQWLIYPAFEHYLCTGDKKFLKERVLPLMEKTALFYEGFLTVTDSNGHWVFVPSYSPENHPANLSTSGAINATMDIAVAKQAFTNSIYAYKELGMQDDPKVARWEALLKNFPPYLINGDGALKEWSLPELEDNYDHRHSSQMYPVWPAHEINPDELPDLTKAARIALEKRGDGDLSTHGIAMKSLVATRLKMDNYLQKKIAQFLSGRFMNRSMVTNHYPDGRIYNCDGISCFPGVINEMLIYSRPGEVELLPALPEQLGNGRASGLRARSKLIVEELEWDIPKKNIRCTIKSYENQIITLKYRKGIRKISVSGPSSDTQLKKEDAIDVKLKKGNIATIDITLL